MTRNDFIPEVVREKFKNILELNQAPGGWEKINAVRLGWQ
jgi:23S rRNA U2552 (ribose-2'-O)-methylase RlmE/FtsJ